MRDDSSPAVKFLLVSVTAMTVRPWVLTPVYRWAVRYFLLTGDGGLPSLPSLSRIRHKTLFIKSFQLKNVFKQNTVYPGSSVHCMEFKI